VVIATPHGPATGFTPRHCRSFCAVTPRPPPNRPATEPVAPILPDRYDNYGSSKSSRQSHSFPNPRPR
jgi:hypothetical protein